MTEERTERPMNRRTLLKAMLAAAAALPLGSLRLRAQATAFAKDHAAMLKDIAAAVLPESLGRRGTDEAADQFLRWIRNYRAGVAMDTGYGNPRPRKTPPLALDKYTAQLHELDRQARARGAAFGALSLADRRALIEAALHEANVDQLPARPAGQHIAADLMGFYFRSADATDLCYGVSIRRYDCRGLADSTKAPDPVAIARRG
jgi:hypothetical protein